MMTNARRLIHFLIGTFLVAIVLPLASAIMTPAHAERRVALVLGIDRYQHLPPLQKAVADARAVAAVLKNDLAFANVITGENLDRRAVTQKLAELDAAIQPGDLVFLFFAGHGVAFGAENYLLAADLPKPGAGQDGLVRDEAFAVDALIRRIKGRGARTAFLVLDACRDNPFGEIGVRSLGLDRGLTRVDAPQGVFVLFSAGLGQKALDRLPGNDPVATSVFTRHLIPALQTPGLTHVQIAKRVQAEVDRVARDGARGHMQQPAYYDQIVGDVMLRPTVGAKGGLQEQATPSAPNGALGANARLKSTMPTAAQKTLVPGRAFRDCSDCPEVIVVTGGRFTMGTTTDPKRKTDEAPTREILVPPFAIGTTAVTLRQYMAWDQHANRFDGDLNCEIWTADKLVASPVASPMQPGFVTDPDHPVVCVSWTAAQNFVAWLSERTGEKYRLASEAEREYVTRAGSKTPFYWGTTIAATMANYDSAHSYGGGRKTPMRDKLLPVRSFPPNPWGVFEVHGNIHDWIHDCYAPYDPKRVDATAVDWPACPTRVVRGGTWLDEPELLRSASRNSFPSGFRSALIGFRVVRELR
jgi:formylglycine-generating enzyme required for sulfatase activity